ncbi:hypothetical protein J1N35_021744 [Gossypium stocksii]|uniref:Uncharacterized protein n=1 Tax=Gossypium stocksii TaxID=47602 RepID=A0A9D4A1L6_9ROSI|nr:hypothetical protein J1N35_021744 [Gossypium stocksii]
MNCFRLPTTLCDEITRTVKNYWWINKGDKRYMYWTGWDRMRTPKFIPGLGFRELKLFNTALLRRQGWGLLRGKETLFSKATDSKYFRHGCFLESKFLPFYGEAYGLLKSCCKKEPDGGLEMESILRLKSMDGYPLMILPRCYRQPLTSIRMMKSASSLTKLTIDGGRT